MSLYLQFKKNDIELCSFSRVSKIYEMFNAFREDWNELTKDKLEDAIRRCEDNFKEIQSELKHQKMIFDKLSKYEELNEVLEIIKELKEERYDIVVAKIQLEVILSILEECSENDKMYWRIS